MNKTIHGHGVVDEKLKPSNRQDYELWRSLLRRCYGKNTHASPDRQICESWHSFRSFLEWTGDKKLSKYMLRLRKGETEFSPENCILFRK